MKLRKTEQSVPLVPAPKPEPPGGWDGWRPFCGHYPIGERYVEAWREGWENSAIITPGADPAMNANGLYWRPVCEGGEAIN